MNARRFLRGCGPRTVAVRCCYALAVDLYEGHHNSGRAYGASCSCAVSEN